MFRAPARATLCSVGWYRRAPFEVTLQKKTKWEMYRFLANLNNGLLPFITAESWHIQSKNVNSKGGSVTFLLPTANDKTVLVNIKCTLADMQSKFFLIPQAPYEKKWYRLRGVKSGELQLAFKYTSPKVQTCREIIKNGTAFYKLLIK